MSLLWQYGITTVLERRCKLFPYTLESLKNAGFDKSIIFLDGATPAEAHSYESQFRLEVVARSPVIYTYSNYIMTLLELYIRNPDYDLYAIFQDDAVFSSHLREYIESYYPPNGYMNLYTFPSNQVLCPQDTNGRQSTGWYPSNQLGKGAVGLLFPREIVCRLLTHKHIIRRPIDNPEWHKKVDGAIIESIRQMGYIEYVHNPSLCQHYGIVSSMGNSLHPRAVSFRGEGYDLRQLIKTNIPNVFPGE